MRRTKKRQKTPSLELQNALRNPLSWIYNKLYAKRNEAAREAEPYLSFIKLQREGMRHQKYICLRAAIARKLSQQDISATLISASSRQAYFLNRNLEHHSYVLIRCNGSSRAS